MRPLLFTFLLLAACQSKPKTEATTAADTTATATVDLTKKAGPDAPRTAADRLVRALYFEHRVKENPFYEAADPRLAEQFFTKPLAAKVLAMAKRTGKKATVNPLFNIPDKQAEKMWVLPATISGDKASVFVTYNDKGKPQEMRCEMTKHDGRFRIADIVYADGSRLSGK
ncbi:hypothetical protein J2I47_09650 [Fibrella sp. HMF5335]|uniref:DUF3828 domain-containing protein n=1 Tax=Fibrella rubiginis TaxID=2817060 RepID=A0A939K522_9BACT|nr:hypothetical protein [Fibrella rubiginis]MBO0936806.1 hypothetical protein [Fibrella rubiginis]